MPSYATHHIFATTVQRVTGDPPARIAANAPIAYRWGAQGPDPLLFYHAPLPNALHRLGQRLYTEPPAPLFEALCEAAVQAHDTTALAYVFGFCTHYALERVTSGFITAQADRLARILPGHPAETRRRMVETDIDGIMIAGYITADPTQYKAYRLLDPGSSECIVLARVLAQAVRETCAVRLSPAAVYRSLHDMRRVLRLAHHGEQLRGHLAHLDRLTGKTDLAAARIPSAQPLAADCANQAHRPWMSNDVERTDSFCDLFDAAVPLAVSLQRIVLERYYQQKPLDARFFPTDLTGTPIKK